MEAKEVGIRVEAVLERETKNTVRYRETPEPGSPAKIGTIYIQKWALPRPFPEKVTITVVWGD